MIATLVSELFETASLNSTELLKVECYGGFDSQPYVDFFMDSSPTKETFVTLLSISLAVEANRGSCCYNNNSKRQTFIYLFKESE